jgi:hypothetical protein
VMVNGVSDTQKAFFRYLLMNPLGFSFVPTCFYPPLLALHHDNAALILI